MPSLLPVASLPHRDRIVISSCTLFVVALAWVYLVHLDHQMSSSMQHDKAMAEMGMAIGPWTAADLLFMFAMWAVMMIGMMAGTIAPVLLLFAGAQRGRGERRIWPPLLMFGFGYLIVWIGFSACATLVQWGLHETAILSPAMAATSPRLGGALLMVVGAYQLTPWKNACLRQCRSPLGFLMANWRHGSAGAMRMGLRHGAYCLGCCWALMCMLFVVGVMNLFWVAALTVFVLIEKIGPAGAKLARVGGAAMIMAGVFLAAGIA